MVEVHAYLHVWSCVAEFVILISRQVLIRGALSLHPPNLQLNHQFNYCAATITPTPILHTKGHIHAAPHPCPAASSELLTICACSSLPGMLGPLADNCEAARDK